MLLVYFAAFFGLLLGAAVGGVVVLLLSRRNSDSENESELLDEWTAAAIDQAAASWVRANGLPDQAAGIMADKLRLLHRLGSERGRS